MLGKISVEKTWDDLPENDIVRRQKEARADVVEPTDTFATETVTIEVGDGMRDVVIRYAIGSTYAFACYADNRPWQREQRALWQACAGDALERFCAIHNLTPAALPRQEDTNAYNMQIETRAPIRRLREAPVGRAHHEANADAPAPRPAANAKPGKRKRYVSPERRAELVAALARGRATAAANRAARKAAAGA